LSAQGYDPSVDYHNYCTAQVWIGKKKVTVGDVIGLALYKEVYAALDRNCPARPGAGGCSGIKNANFKSTCMRRWPTDTVECKPKSPNNMLNRTLIALNVGTTNIWDIHARWENPNIRVLLIAAVAGALQQVTYENFIGPSKCFDMAGARACNVGDAVRVSLICLLAF
jgi:hypothetical protein